MENNIKLSIVTATFNSSGTILNLINEFRKSKSSLVEWIIIDNKSSDNTTDIISANLDVVDKFVSEKDFGIYDAWNKGVRLAEGDFISFIGSDDSINSTYFDVALNAINKYPKNNIIGFKILYKSNNGNYYLNSTKYSLPFNYPFNLGFYHPGTLHSNKLFESNYFDISFKIAGDREFLTRVHKSLDPIIIDTEAYQIIHNYGGISTTPSYKLLQHKEVLRIFFKNRVNNIFIYCFMVFSYFKILIFKFKQFK